MTSTFSTLTALLITMLGMTGEEAKELARDKSKWHEESVQCIVWRTENTRIDQAQLLRYYPYTILKVPKFLRRVEGGWNGPAVLVLDENNNPIHYEPTKAGFRWGIPSSKLLEFLGLGELIRNNFVIYMPKEAERHGDPWFTVEPEADVKDSKFKTREDSGHFFLKQAKTPTGFRYETAITSYKIEFGTKHEIEHKLARFMLGMSEEDRVAVLSRLHHEEERKHLRNLMEEVLVVDRESKDYFVNPNMDNDVAVAWWYGKQAYSHHYHAHALGLFLDQEGAAPREIIKPVATIHRFQDAGFVVMPSIQQMTGSPEGNLEAAEPEERFKEVFIRKIPAKEKFLEGFEIAAEPFLADFVKKALVKKRQRLRGELFLWHNWGSSKIPPSKIEGTATEFTEGKWYIEVRHKHENTFIVGDTEMSAWELQFRILERNFPMRGRSFPIKYVPKLIP